MLRLGREAQAQGLGRQWARQLRKMAPQRRHKRARGSVAPDVTVPAHSGVEGDVWRLARRRPWPRRQGC